MKLLPPNEKERCDGPSDWAEFIRWFLPEGYLLGSADSKFPDRVRRWTDLSKLLSKSSPSGLAYTIMTTDAYCIEFKA